MRDLVITRQFGDPRQTPVTSLVATGVRIPAFADGRERWRKTAPLPVQLPKAACEARCGIALELDEKEMYGMLKLVIAGENAFAESPSISFSGEEASAGVTVQGEAPVSLGTSLPQGFRFSQLPAGEYRVLVRHAAHLWLPQELLMKHADLKEGIEQWAKSKVYEARPPVRLVEGEAVDLGLITLKMPQALRALVKRVKGLKR